MAEVSTIARPYAKAAFSHAESKDELAQWSSVLALASELASHEDMMKVLESPALSAEQKASIFIDVCGDGLTGEAKNFIKVLAEHKRLAALPAITEAFEVLKANREQSIDVEVTSAFEMSAEQQEKLASKLKNNWQKEISIQVKIDKSLIGGVIIHAGDIVIDGSVRGKLSQLAESVNS